MARAGLTLDVEAPVTPVAVGGAESLRRLLLILFDNALKYTPEGGHARARVQEAPGGEAGEVIVDVEDTGVGFAQGDRAHAFDPFYRGASARARAPEGAGLGLAIARTMVERRRGAIAIAPGGAAPGVACW